MQRQSPRGEYAGFRSPHALLADCLTLLGPPSYGYERDGQLYVPSHTELWREFFGRLNIFRSRKNWLSFWCWTTTLSLLVPLGLFVVRYRSWQLFVAGFVYGMVVLGSHGTFWLHRYSTH